MSIANVKYENNKLIIEIDKNDLLYLANNHPYGYEIVDEESFFEYVKNNLTDFNEEEDGCTQFYRLFDDLLNYAYEDGEEFVINPEYDDEDEDYDEE